MSNNNSSNNSNRGGKNGKNGGFRGASGRREHFVGRSLNARSRGRDAQGNDRDLRASRGRGDLPAARFDARRAVFRL